MVFCPVPSMKAHAVTVEFDDLKKAVAERLAQREDEGRPERWIEQKPAFAVFKNPHIQIQCMIIDMSAVGACIGLPRAGDVDFVDPDSLPDQMTLDNRRESTETECEIVWRADSRLGLRFLSLPQPY